MSPLPLHPVPTRTARRAGTAPPALRQQPPPDPPACCLNRRERAVVVALCEGLDRPAIAERLRRSRSTCDKAISAIYRATGFGSAHQVVAWAHRVGLFGSGPAAAHGRRR